jgi:mono/diheme cytochrome c family protein
VKVAAVAMVVLGVWPGLAAATARVAARPLFPLQATGEWRSVWDGVYTDAQAKRGQEFYEYSCAACHLPDLEGDPGRDVPALAGEVFLTAWRNRPLKELFDLMGKSMPKDSPASLRPQAYADLVAYLLQFNEFPAGDRELAPEPSSLERVGFGRTPSQTEK